MNPTIPLFLFPCGTNPNGFDNAGDVADGGPLDQRRIGRSTRRSRGRGPPDLIKHVPNKRSYNGQIRSDVAASHALIEWTCGPHIADQTRAH